MRIQRLLGGAAAVLALAAATTPAAAQAPPCATDGTPCKLSVGLDDTRVINPFISPDGARVVFNHLGRAPGTEVFSAPIAGGSPPVKLSVPGSRALVVAISPDSTRVVYTQQTDPDRTGLFSVPIAGPASASVMLAADVRTTGFPPARISADSRKVVFVPRSGDRLQVVPTAGPASAGARLTDPFVAGGQVGRFQISGSGSAVYEADQNVDGQVELFRVPLTLTPPPDPSTARLNGALPAGGDVFDFTLAPNNGPVVYRADQDTDNVVELFSVRVGGAGRVKISRPLPPGFDVAVPVEGDVPARVTPDGSHVVYEIGTVVGSRIFRELHSVPIAGPGGASVRLDHPPLVPPGEIATIQYKLSADGSRVVYSMQDQHIGEPNAPTISLVSVPTKGPASDGRLLASPLTDVPIHALSPDSTRVAFVIQGSTQNNLFGIPIAGGTAVRLNGTETAGGQLSIGDRVVYTARTGSLGALFSAPVDGNGARRNLTASLGEVEFVLQAVLTPDGTRAVYTLSRSGQSAELELFSSRLVPAP